MKARQDVAELLSAGSCGGGMARRLEEDSRCGARRGRGRATPDLGGGGVGSALLPTEGCMKKMVSQTFPSTRTPGLKDIGVRHDLADPRPYFSDAEYQDGSSITI